MDKSMIRIPIDRGEALALLGMTPYVKIEVRSGLKGCSVMAGLTKHDIEDVEQGSWGGPGEVFEVWIGA